MTPPLTPSKCRSAVAVADHKQFTAAADALGITSSTVSINVSRLEKDLGFNLFDRPMKGSHGALIKVSDKGKPVLRMLRRAVKAFDDLDTYLHELDVARQPPTRQVVR